MELDLVKIIKNLKKLRLLSKSKLVDAKTEFLLKHNHKNVINLDSSDLSDCCEDDISDYSENHDHDVQKVLKHLD